MKRKAFGIAVVVLVLSMLAYGSLAYFTAEATAHNVITSGGINIDLLEWADTEKETEFPSDGIPNVMPDTDVTKIVEVKNTGEDAAFVRIQVEKAIKLLNSQEDVDLDLMTLDFNTTDWALQDGYYYYNNILAGGETTAPLFTAVSFSKDMGNQYQNSTATVDVTAYAVQVANNGTDPLTAQGWPETEE